jgi:hypothetical protein
MPGLSTTQLVKPPNRKNLLTNTFQAVKSRAKLPCHFIKTAKIEIGRKSPPKIGGLFYCNQLKENQLKNPKGKQA